jgi:hypothetical protein
MAGRVARKNTALSFLPQVEIPPGKSEILTVVLGAFLIGNMVK